MNIEKAKRWIKHQHAISEGSDLQVAVKGADQSATGFVVLLMVVAAWVSRLDVVSHPVSMVSILSLTITLIVIGITYSTLIKIRDYLIENNVQNLDEIEKSEQTTAH